MTRYRCNTWGLAGWTSYESDVDLSNDVSVSCTKISDEDQIGTVNNPEIQPPVTFTPSPPAGIEGLDPMAPGGPGQNFTWSERVLAFLFGDDDEAVTPKAPASAGGCCPNGQPRCLRCWLKKNAGWLFIAGLAFAAFLLRKRP